jgi:hypothetical protein
MNKKIIVFGSFLAVFLMLITPNVNAIRFNQVENNFIKKINHFKEQFKIKDINSVYKSKDIERLKQVINEIKYFPNGLCSSCIKNSINRPICKALGILAGILLIKIIESYENVIAEKLLYALVFLYNFGLVIGCKWAWLTYAFIHLPWTPEKQ